MGVCDALMSWESNNLLDFLLFPFQSFPTVKENETTLYLDPVSICGLALDDFRLLALMSPVADEDLFSYGKAFHRHLSWLAALGASVVQDHRKMGCFLYPHKSGRASGLVQTNADPVA